MPNASGILRCVYYRRSACSLRNNSPAVRRATVFESGQNRATVLVPLQQRDPLSSNFHSIRPVIPFEYRNDLTHDVLLSTMQLLKPPTEPLAHFVREVLELPFGGGCCSYYECARGFGSESRNRDKLWAPMSLSILPVRSRTSGATVSVPLPDCSAPLSNSS